MTSLTKRTSEIARIPRTSAISKVIQSIVRWFAIVDCCIQHVYTRPDAKKRSGVRVIGRRRRLVRASDRVQVLAHGKPSNLSAEGAASRCGASTFAVQITASTSGGRPTAPLLVYLHGWADTGSTFQFVVDAFGERLARHCAGLARFRPVGLAIARATGFRTTWRICTSCWRSFRRANRYGSSATAWERMSASLYAGSFPERVAAFVNIEGFGLVDSNPDDAPLRYRAWIEGASAGPTFNEYADLAALARRIRKRHPAMTLAQAIFVAA